MNPFWLEALSVAFLAGIAAVAAWILWGPVWFMLVAGTAILIYGLHHLRQLSRLLNWLEQPQGVPLPAGGGAWELIFAALHRRARQAAEEHDRLSLALERFRHAGQALPDGVVILDANLAIEWLNATAEGHLGLNQVQDVGSPVTNLLREPDFVTYIESGQYLDPLILHPLRNPGRTLALQIVPYGESQKLLLSRDITQLDKLENMRRDFVANVSHELKTPLTVVSGFIETLIDSLPELSAQEAEHFLMLADQQARRMQSLIEDLLTLSMLETGSPPPSEERVVLNELLTEIVDEARALSNGRHQIKLEALPTDTLLGSRNELRSAFGNLISNAVRYTPENGHIHISWQRTDEGGGIFSVRDDGIGIESNHLPRLTERFYRVDRGRSRESGGTGLGLAIVKHALTRHQVVLEIISEPGRGSTFSARFPPQRIAAIAA